MEVGGKWFQLSTTGFFHIVLTVFYCQLAHDRQVECTFKYNSSEEKTFLFKKKVWGVSAELFIASMRAGVGFK